MTIGFLVRSTDNDLGIGKIISLDSPYATVEYFSSIGQRISKTILITSLGRIKLERQTRCYLYQEEEKTWQIGRIYAWDEEKEQYQADLPDNKMIFAKESQIYVRCNRPIEDPIDILAMKGQETPYFHKQRSRFLKTLIEQRAISRGMTGLLSANIELYPHQVEVIRRVLEDPIQRYLLADEVGLGKTIEAGVILRQFLLDEPTEKALILVPPSLFDQWQQELEDKFYLSQFPNRVTFLSTKDWKELENTNNKYSFLIIDEAHHVAAMSTSGDPLKRCCFNTCLKLAHKCKNLLLLSATPVLNHEQDFLTMLHFLDPVTYQLDDLEGFRERVEKQQEIGRVLLPFKKGVNPFVLKKSLQNMVTLFSQDQTLLSLIDDLQKQQESDQINKKIGFIRSYIGDTYRLHRRMLRTRRATIEDVIFERNAVPKFEYDLDERVYTLYELLDQWRITAPDESNYHRIFILLFCASNTWLGLLKQVVESRLKGIIKNSLVQDFGNSDCKILRDTPHFEGEENILESILNLLNNPSEDGDRLELLKILILYHLADVLNLQTYKGNLQDLQQRIQQRINRPFSDDKLPKLIIFSSFTETSRAIFDYLSAIFGSRIVVSYRRDFDQETIKDNLNQFRNNSQCFILVVDPSGEEGRNLQFVDGVIHFDLPFSPNKLEQRLGRVDRIGGKQSINSWLLAGIDLEDSLYEFWYQILNEGFNIFKHSIASLQFYVEAKIPQIKQALFRFDANSIKETIEQIKQEIEAENLKNSEQNALDEIETYSEGGRDHFQTLESYDQEHKKLEKATEGWLVSALRFRRSYDDNLQDVRKYKPTEKTLVPLKDLKKYFATKMRYKGVYNRRLANKYSGVNLYRIGEGLIDTLADYLTGDERGKAFAIWRQEETWDSSEGGEWLGFRFDYLIEVDWQKIQSVLQELNLSEFNEKSLKRRGDALFPPLLKTVFLDRDYQRVEDESLLKILQRSYTRQGKENKDYNLAKDRLSILDQFIEPGQWESFCLEVRQRSETSLRTSGDFLEYCEQHKAIAKTKLANRLHQLEGRYQRFSDPQLAQEITLETALSEAFLTSISYPSFRLDAVGFIIVSGRYPS